MEHQKAPKNMESVFILINGKFVRQLTQPFISVPSILRVCSKCIEHRGLVDGIYRLSGISSNIRALK
jgi:hypothetical protein